MSVNLDVSDFSADFFTLDQENRPTDGDQFFKGLGLLALRALDALSKLGDVELAFYQIERVNLLGLRDEDKKDVDQRIRDVFKNWVKVSFGNHFRHVPRKRLAEQCGPKFHAQYTSGMKEASDRELDLQSLDPSSTDSCPEACKALLLVYLQTGALPPGTLGDNALNMIVLAEQHQLEELIQECLDFLIDNLSLENLGTFLEFTQQTPFPRLGLACLNFMQTNRDSIPDGLKTKYQEKLSIIEALARGRITLKLSSSGIIEAQVETITGQTADSLQKINKQFLITSLILPVPAQNNLFNFLEQIAPILKSLQDLIIWNETPTDNDLAKLKGLFPNLKALGNDASFLKTFDEVKTYVKNFRKPGVDEQESKKTLLRSINLTEVPNLTDAQLAELVPYLQELYHLFIVSDKITSLVAPKATWVKCTGCTRLITLKAPKATTVDCRGCTELTTLEAPEATWVDCRYCTKLTTLEAPKATSVNCYGCTALTTLETPKATRVFCSWCTALTTLEAPEAIEVGCCRCTALTTLEAPKATKDDCRGCTALTTFTAPLATVLLIGGCTAITSLEAPKATFVNCTRCTALITLKAPRATRVHCDGCTKLKTLTAPQATAVRSQGCTALTPLEKPSCSLL